MERPKRWWILAGMLLLALLPASCASDPVGTPAPDFTLELGAGGTFVLSEQTEPVLVVFWAEW